MGAAQITNWGEIEKLAIAGVSIPDLAIRFDMKQNTIRARALRHKWPTPLAIAQRARELEAQGPKPTTDLITAAAEDWNAKGEAHRKQSFEIATESVGMFRPKAPKNFRELKAADDIARRAAGLDIGENNNQTLIMMHERVNAFEDEQPEEIIEADVVVESVEDTTPALPAHTEAAPADDSSSDTPA